VGRRGAAKGLHLILGVDDLLPLDVGPLKGLQGARVERLRGLHKSPQGLKAVAAVHLVRVRVRVRVRVGVGVGVGVGVRVIALLSTSVATGGAGSMEPPPRAITGTSWSHISTLLRISA